MALALENANLVWQKAKTAMLNANPALQEELKDLKLYLASQKRNFNLQYIPFAAEDITTNLGYTQGVGVAHTLYAVYTKGRRTTGTTSSFFAVHDAADNSASTTTIVTARFKATGQEYLSTFPAGIAMATDITLSAATAVGGATESTAADACDGFVIIGA